MKRVLLFVLAFAAVIPAQADGSDIPSASPITTAPVDTRPILFHDGNEERGYVYMNDRGFMFHIPAYHDDDAFRSFKRTGRLEVLPDLRVHRRAPEGQVIHIDFSTISFEIEDDTTFTLTLAIDEDQATFSTDEDPMYKLMEIRNEYYEQGAEFTLQKYPQIQGVADFLERNGLNMDLFLKIFDPQEEGPSMIDIIEDKDKIQVAIKAHEVFQTEGAFAVKDQYPELSEILIPAFAEFQRNGVSLQKFIEIYESNQGNSLETFDDFLLAERKKEIAQIINPEELRAIITNDDTHEEVRAAALENPHAPFDLVLTYFFEPARGYYEFVAAIRHLDRRPDPVAPDLADPPTGFYTTQRDFLFRKCMQLWGGYKLRYGYSILLMLLEVPEHKLRFERHEIDTFMEQGGGEFRMLLYNNDAFLEEPEEQTDN